MKKPSARKSVTITMLRRSSRQASARHAHREPDGEQERADQHARNGPDERHGVGPRPAAAERERCLTAGSDERPRVVGVDRQVRIAGRRLGHLADEGDDVERERGDDDEQHEERDDSRRDESPRAVLVLEPATQPLREQDAVVRLLDPGRNRWRRSSTMPTSGSSTTPNWGLISAASTASPAAPSELPRMSAADREQHDSAPKASVWPQIAESYQVTGLNR